MVTISKQKFCTMVFVLLPSLMILTGINRTVASTMFAGNASDVSAYLYVRISTITAADGSPSLQSRVEKYPVLYADFGGRCEYFLKNPRQDITRGSRPTERVYFKDVTAIRAFKGVPVSSDRFGLNVFAHGKAYQVRKWSGMAALKDDVHGGDCRNLSDEKITYTWPVLHFKVIAPDKTVQWIEADLKNIVEFGYDRDKGRRLYRSILDNYKQQPRSDRPRNKDFEKLKEEAQARAERREKEKEQQDQDETAAQLLNEQLVQYRANLAEGDDSHCGLVIEVKDKVVKVQATVGEYWLKRNQLFPSGMKPCNFLNGVYLEP